MKIRKRNGRDVNFDREKIVAAISKANESVAKADKLSEGQIEKISQDIESECLAENRLISVAEIQDKISLAIMKAGGYRLALAYTGYRHKRELRSKANTIDDRIFAIVDGESDEAKGENSNKNPTILPTQRDYIAGEVSRDMTRRYLLPPDIMAAHDEGRIHFHDADYFIGHITNCELVNLDDMLQNGTVITDTLIEKPHLFSTACNIACQVISQVASSTFGGQTISLTHLAKFVDVSRQAFITDLRNELDKANVAITAEQFNSMVNDRLLKDIKAGIQTIQYQVITLLTTNGQAPFITVFLDLGEADTPQLKADLALCIEEMLKQRIQGVKNEKGVWITPAFPKLIYVLDEDNVREGTPYFYLTELAAQCTAKRMAPDYISAKKMRELKGDIYPCMGCRSFLTPDRFTDAGLGNMANAGNYEPGKHKYYGRWNQGVVTVNLPFVALTSGGDLKEFWRYFDETLELCHRALRLRHERLRGTKSDVAPILWQHGALARLEKGETIDKLLYNGYSTISLGYAGLYECVKYLTGKSHTDPKAKPLALKIMQRMNDKCAEWKATENIDYSLYGTPQLTPRGARTVMCDEKAA